jgi:hypothetical protein
MTEAEIQKGDEGKYFRLHLRSSSQTANAQTKLELRMYARPAHVRALWAHHHYYPAKL